jgi:hypothetical protein
MLRHKLPVASRVGRIVTVLTALFGFLAGLTLVVTHAAGQGGASTVAQHQSSPSTRSFPHFVGHRRHYHGNPSLTQPSLWWHQHASPSPSLSPSTSASSGSSSPAPGSSSVGGSLPSPTSTQVMPQASVQPDGPPGNWKLVWSDEFNGTSVDTSKWYVWDNGTVRNGVPTYASNVSESGGSLNLTLQSSTSGASVTSSDQFGNNPAPSDGFRMAVGDAVEARIWFPAAANGEVANWPSIWFFGGPDTSAPGEIDLFEGLGGSATSNYHPPSGSATINSYPAGSWAGSWHIYTIVRNATSFDAYVDGHLFLVQPTSDDGSPMSINLVYGAGQNGPPVYPATMRVDYVRAWSPA